MNAKNSDHIQAIFITNDKKIYLTNGLKNNSSLMPIQVITKATSSSLEAANYVPES